MIFELMMVIAIDGDTVKYNGERIRLHGIDTPELSQTCHLNDEVIKCGKIARDRLAELVKDGVKCVQTDYDARWKRPVAKCLNTDNADVSQTLIAEGLGLAYRKYSEDYVMDEERAHQENLGMWKGTFIEPWQWRKGKRW